MLWIGLHLPWLSLEAFLATLPSGSAGAPVALADRFGVLAVNGAAQALGVQPGMKRPTALALVPQLTFGEADERRDAAGLMAVAHAALAFTPTVCLVPPAGVVLEVQSTLRYFGGFERLLQRLTLALRPLGHRVWRASGATAQGAVLLSRHRDGLHCPEAPDLLRTLARLPVHLLDSAQPHLDTLTGMGLRQAGDLQRLPRDGLMRRFGEGLVEELDTAWGRRPDPRQALALPDVFDSQVELFARADTTEQLLQGAEVLLARLVAWLSGHHAFVRRFQLRLHHEGRSRRSEGPAITPLDVALAEPSRDLDHLQSLLRERLAALQLPAPTLELALHAEDIARQPPPNAELFPTARSEHQGLTRLIERLQARLGPARVQRIVRVADHRPERCVAVQAYEPGPPPRPPEPVTGASRRPARRQARSSRDEPALAPAKLPDLRACPAEPARPPPRGRPVWLLPEPQALSERDSLPVWSGQVLQLLCGPERIECGWWDAALAERDYFIAQTQEGALVWIYRARLPLSQEATGGGWFLQGLFG